VDVVIGVFRELIDVRGEEKAAALVQFAGGTAPELLQLSRVQGERQALITAEKRLHAGDTKGAQELAQQAMDKKIGDQGRALFILAEVAVANKNMPAALDDFHRAIAEAKEARVIAWSRTPPQSGRCAATPHRAITTITMSPALMATWTAARECG